MQPGFYLLSKPAQAPWPLLQGEAQPGREHHRVLFCFQQSLSPVFLASFYVNSGALLAESEFFFFFFFPAALWLLDSIDLKLVHGDPDTHHSSETTRELCSEGCRASKQPE